jgi:hypothetical protein
MRDIYVQKELNDIKGQAFSLTYDLAPSPLSPSPSENAWPSIII